MIIAAASSLRQAMANDLQRGYKNHIKQKKNMTTINGNSNLAVNIKRCQKIKKNLKIYQAYKQSG